MSLNIPLPPGMTVEKDSSDSDEEAVAARKQRKMERMAREERDRKREEQEAKDLERRKAEEAESELVLRTICDASERERVLESLSGGRPEAFEERQATAGELREAAKAAFGAAEHRQAIDKWLGAVWCLDFTANELAKRTPEERKAVAEALTAVLSNLSMAFRKEGKVKQACSAADAGLDVARRLTFEESKPLRVKLRFRRALAKGDLRDFAGAREDAQHVLQLAPDHEEAKCMVRNCDVASRREKGPPEQRWRGSLTVAIPKKVAPAQPWSSSWRLALAFLAVLLALLVARFAF